MKRYFQGRMTAGLLAALVLIFLIQPAFALRIRDAVRMKNDVPNELVGMGLVVGLNGTGDGDDSLPAMRRLAALMKGLGDQGVTEKDLKNAKNVAIVSLSLSIPAMGAHEGDRLDVKVSGIASKSLKGGRLIFVPMYAPTPDKMILASATGDLTVDGDNLQGAVIRNGGVMMRDVLPYEIKGNTFTLVLYPQMASPELATAIADQINQEVAPQTNGHWVAFAADSTSVQVTIPDAEQRNTTPFLGRIMMLTLPSLPDPAKVTINKKDKLITFSDEVEVAPTLISQGNLTITIGAPNPASGPKGQSNFAVIDPHGNGNAKLRDLQNALSVLKVSADDRIAIVRGLNKQGALKAQLVDE